LFYQASRRDGIRGRSPNQLDLLGEHVVVVRVGARETLEIVRLRRQDDRYPLRAATEQAVPTNTSAGVVLFRERSA
jgi:hypothetical protein